MLFYYFHLQYKFMYVNLLQKKNDKKNKQNGKLVTKKI